jgi:hypothetical protein
MNLAKRLHAALGAGLCGVIPVHFSFLAGSFGRRRLISRKPRRCERDGEAQGNHDRNEFLHWRSPPRGALPI